MTAEFGGRPHSALALFLGRSIPFTSYAVVVPIEFKSIARLTAQERCNAGIAGSVAILVIGERFRRRRWWGVLGRVHRWGGHVRRGLRRHVLGRRRSEHGGRRYRAR
ncbi:hypothetical protein RHRU231_960098 [Rhodococcus ruber]|uniref:Uncharacterized protein n=1 Tax=Rhodococcus ruber TaxID=1830 RepID=A0A098BV17_9NOCA|nr:hypothetical protein RHRU231_960098 [Rhodococcus ruber]